MPRVSHCDNIELISTCKHKPSCPVGPTGLAGLDYIFAYTSIPQLTILEDTYQDITFEHMGPLNGWRLIGTTDFLVPNTGTYSIQYSGIGWLLSPLTIPTTIRTGVIQGGFPIPGSFQSTTIDTIESPYNISCQFISNLGSNTILNFQFLGSTSGNVGISPFIDSQAFRVAIIRIA